LRGGLVPAAGDQTVRLSTGRSLLAFGGELGASKATHNVQVPLRDVAAFTPAVG
jgi:hypothetical protein